jgi:hypothetical protein
MKRIVFLLEEYSMKVLLDGLLPRLLPSVAFLCVPHEGKQDLEKSVSRKLKAWREPGVRFVVVRDNDGGDCRALKARLVAMCREAERGDTLVRIACQELEAWYLGDPEALARAFEDPALARIAQKARFRDPDGVMQPAQALQELAPSFQKVSGARAIAPLLDETRNTSASFRAFVAGVRRVAASPGRGRNR